MGFGAHGQHTSGKQGVEETKKNNNGPESAERDKKMRFFREQITFVLLSLSFVLRCGNRYSIKQPPNYIESTFNLDIDICYSLYVWRDPGSMSQSCCPIPRRTREMMPGFWTTNPERVLLTLLAG